MEINKKTFLILPFLGLSFISCQTKEVINFTKYESLTLDSKQEVDEYLPDAKKIVINYDFKNWHVVLNKKNEITFLSPIPISGCMKSILMNKKLKFSDSYEDITFSNPSPGCSKLTH